ncbi:MAG: hypothetical protein WBA57_00185 [Elainellaceae cyanobacterium]
MLNLNQPIAMVKLGLLFTAYLFVSLGIFFVMSNTINGGIIYLFLLLPFYGAVLLTSWIVIWQRRTQRARVQWSIWGLVLALQIAVVFTSPGNCFGTKQGDRCYSNLQIVAGSAARTGANQLPHWTIVEDAFPFFVIAYDVAIAVGLRKILV